MFTFDHMLALGSGECICKGSRVMIAARPRLAAISLAGAGLAVMLVIAPVLARDSLGLFAGWGAFRDAGTPRCYAIAIAAPSTLQRDYQPYATIGTWPRRNLRNQVHWRVSRKLVPTGKIRLQIGSDRYELTGGGGDVWPLDANMNAAIVARMRSASSMTVYATDTNGRSFSNTWQLAGAASAMDAAALGCARLR